MLSPILAQGQATCGPVWLPFEEGFESTGILPPCWERWQNFDREDYKACIVNSPTPAHGTGALMITSGPDDEPEHRSVVLGRNLRLSPTGIRVRMNLRTNLAGARLVIGVADSALQAIAEFGFVGVDTITIATANTWVAYEVDFGNYQGNGRRFALRMDRGLQPGSMAKIYVDDVELERCSVENLNISHLTATTLRVNWTMSGNGTTNIDVKNSQGTTVHSAQGVSSPYTVTGLLPETTYTVVLTPQCSGEATAGNTQSASATTLPDTRPALAYCEGFEGGLSYWLTSGTATASTLRKYLGARSLYLNSGDRAAVAVPGDGTTAISELVVGLKMYASTTGSRLVVKATDFPGEPSEATTIATLAPTYSGGWETHRFELAAHSGTERYLVLTATGGSVYIDELRIGRCSVENVEVSEVTSESITLSWDAPRGATSVTLTPTGNGPSVTVSEANCTVANGRWTYTLGGLTAGTTYTYNVQADCDDSPCGTETVQATTFAQQYTLPYCQDFESATSLPTDWHATQSYSNAPVIVGAEHHGGTRSLRLNCYGSSSPCVATLPPIEATGTVTVSLAATANSSGASLEIGTLTNANNPATFTAAATITPTSGAWNRHMVTIALGSGQRIALRLTSTSGSRLVWVDDLEVSHSGVSDVTSYGQRATAVTLAWNQSNGSACTIRLVGGASERTFENATSPLEIGNLTQGTSYDCYMRTSTAQADEGCEVYVGTISTASGALTADYCHPSTISVGYNGTWTLPYLEETSFSNLMASLDVTGSGTLAIGLMTNPSDPSTFTQLASITANGNSQHLYASLQGHESHGHYIALRSTNGSATVSNLRVVHGEAVAVTVGTVTATSADIAWTTNGAVDSVAVTYSATGSTQTVTSTADTLTLPNLTAGSQYTVSVAPIRNGQPTCASATATFSTLGSDIGPGWCEDFSGGTLPTGWNVLVGDNYSAAIYGGYLELDGWNGDVLVTLPTSTGSVNGLKMKLEARCSSGSCGAVVVGVMTNPALAQTFTPVSTLTPTNTWQTYIADLTAYTGNGRTLALRYTGSSYVQLDNLTLLNAQVYDLHASHITNRSVHLTWDGEASAEIRVKQGSTLIATLTGTNHEAVIDGLQSGTEYTLEAIADGVLQKGDCLWQRVSFRTLDQVMEAPLCLGLDDYNSSTQLPYGWSRISNSTYPNSTTSYHYDGNRSIYLRTRGYDGSTMLVSPMMEDNLQGLTLSFYLKTSSSTGLQSLVTVGTIASPDDTSTFHPIAQIAPTLDWERHEVSLSASPSAHHYIAFRYASTYYSSTTYTYAYLDAVMLQHCPMPTLSVSHPEATSMQLHWDGNAPLWVEYSSNGSTFSTPVLASSQPFTITGLTPQTDYTIRAWPSCNDGAADFVCHKSTVSQRTLPPPQPFPYCTSIDEATTLGSNNPLLMEPRMGVESLCPTLDQFYLEIAVYVHSAGTLEAGLVTDFSDPSTFSPIASLNLEESGSWQEYFVPLSRSELESGFVALRLTDGMATIGGICINSCFASQARITATTPTTITVEWESHGNGQFTIDLTLPGGSTQQYQPAASPFTLTGLTPNATYSLNYSTVCDCGIVSVLNSEDYPSQQTVRLPAEPMEVPVCHNFDNLPSGAFPDEWRRNNGYNNYPRVSTSYSHSGNRSLDFYTPGTLVLDPLPDGVGDVVVSGMVYSTSTNSAVAAPLTIGVTNDDSGNSAITPAGTVVIEAVGLWQPFHVLIPATLRGTMNYLVLQFDPYGSFHLYLDDLSVSGCAVRSLSADDEQLHLSPLGAASQYQITINGTRSHTVTDTTVSLSALGLDDDSVYTLSAAPLCGSLSPLCNNPTITVGSRIALPHCEDFSTTSLQPEGWEVMERCGPTYPRVDGNRYHLRPSYSDGQTETVVLPKVPSGSTLGGLCVRMDVSCSGYNYAYIELGHIAGGQFVSLATLHNTQANQTHHVVLPPCSATRLAIRARSTSGSRDIYVDNLQLTRYPEPSSFTLGHSGYRWQHLSWSDGASFYRIEYGPTGFTPGQGTVVATDSCHALLGPLAGGQAYDFYFVDTLGNRFCHPHSFTAMPAAQQAAYCDNTTHTIGSGQTYVLPEISDSLHNTTLLITYRTTQQLVVGVRGDRDLASTFVAIDTLPSTNGSYLRAAVDMGAYADTGHFVTLQVLGTTAYVNQLTLQEIPQPSFRAMSSSTIAASLEADEADYWLEVRRVGSSQGHTIHVTSPNYLIQNLQPYTQYDLYVSADGSTCAPAVRIRTLLDIEVPYCTDNPSSATGWQSIGACRMLPRPLVDSLQQLYVSLTGSGNVSLYATLHQDDTAGRVLLATVPCDGLARQTLRLADYSAQIGDLHYLALEGSVDQLYLHLCPVPQAELATFNSVRFTLPDDEAADYYLRYGATQLHVSDNPFTLANLEQNTLYQFHVDCNPDESSCLPTLDVLTGVEITAPHCADLGDYHFSGSSVLPAGWFSLAGANGVRYAIMPIINIDSLTHLFMRIAYRMDASGTQLTVGVMDDPADESTFSVVEQLPSSTDNASALVNLQAYSGDGRYLAFRASGSNPSTLTLTRVELQEVPFVDYRLISYNTVEVTPADGLAFHRPATILTADGTSTAVDSLPFTLGGLATDHFYQFTLTTPGTTPCIAPSPVSTTSPLATPTCGLTASLSASAPMWHGPELTEADISSLTMRAHVSLTASDSRVVVGTLRIGNADSTFQPIDTLQAGLSTVDFTRHSGSGRFLAFRLLGGGSATLTDVTLDHCLLPQGATATLVRHNQVQIAASGNDPIPSPLYLEYTPAGTTSTTVMRVDNLPLTLTLANSTTYNFRLRCDSAISPCSEPFSVTTMAPPPALSWCEDFNSQPTGQAPTAWPVVLPVSSSQQVQVVANRSHSASRSLYFNSLSGRQNIVVLPDLGLDSLTGLSLSLWMWTNLPADAALEVGIISNPADAETFFPLHTLRCTQGSQWQRFIVDLADAPHDAVFLALRCMGSTGTNRLWIDDLHVAECGANSMSIAQIEANQVTLQWRQTGVPSVSIVATADDGTTTEVAVPDSTVDGLRQYTVDGLSPLTNYRFVLNAVCGASDSYCTTNYSDSATLFTPAGGTGCIDPTNLTAQYTTCFYGSYNNPYANIGVIDNGYLNATSRHTIHYNLSERDPRTGGLLPTMPEGAAASVRLGNWNTAGANPSNPDPGEAESIVYSLYVDTLDFDLLVMRYAAVLQDNFHPASKQPRFSLELLDEQMQVLDATCGRADFIANYALGWNAAADEVLWKDWTTVGIDMTPYAGQTVYIRLTTRDCNEGSHYGYAYFTLECQHKNIEAGGCGVISENQFTAPSGFNYRWYTSADDATYSTSQTITVPSNNDITYYCDLSFVDNPGCSFTMSAFAGTRFPLSQFDYEVSLGPCSFVVNFYNRSTISMDGTTPIGSNEGCETALWSFGDGDSSTSYHTSHVYTAPGTYEVTLTSGIANDQCTHTLTIPITLAFPPSSLSLEGPADRCINSPSDTLRLSGVAALPSPGEWQAVATDGRFTDYILPVSPTQTSTYTIQAVDSVGCLTDLSHTLNVHPTFHTSDRVDICSLLLPYTWRDTSFADTTHSSFHTLHRQSQFGCDSILDLDLHVYDNALFTRRDTLHTHICANQSFAFGPQATLYNLQGLYTDSLFTTIGCDSLSTLDLVVYDTFDHHTFDTICSNQSVAWGGASVDAYGTSDHDTVPTFSLHPLALHSVHGCDSASTLHLTVQPAYHFHTPDTICDNQWRNFIDSAFNQPGAHSFHYLSARGCDSTQTLDLFVHPTFDHHTYQDICSNQQATWGDSTFVGYGLTTTDSVDLLSTHPRMLSSVHGCDSLSTLHLTIHPAYDHHSWDTICSNQGIAWGGQTLTSYGYVTDSTAPYAPIAEDHPLALTSRHQCDSASTLHLTIRPAFDFHTLDTICDDTIRFFIAAAYNQTGAYPYAYASLLGCDSTQTLDLKVYPTYDLHIFDTIYDGDTYHFEGSTYDTTGIHPHLLAATFGCDSLRTLHLKRNWRTYNDSSICQNHQPLTWNGVSFTQSQGQRRAGYYYVADSITLPGRQETDSLVVMRVHILDTSATYDVIHACDSMQWRNGVVYTASTAAPFVTLQNHWQCDSVRHLSLTVDYTQRTVDPQVVCDSLVWIDSRAYHADTVGPLDTLRTVADCDSIVTLDLTVHYSTYHGDIDTFCFDQTYAWRDHEIEATGYYTDTLRTIHGCDSVRAITLTQMPKPDIAFSDSIDCAHLRHLIVATPDQPDYFTRWKASPSDPSLAGQERRLDIAVRPQQTTTYYLTVDFDPYTLCPYTDSISAIRVWIPDAELKVTPDALSYSNLWFDAYDISDEGLQRRWLINWEEQGESGRQLTRQVLDESVDTVIVALEVYNNICYDTAIYLLPVLRSDIFLPNVFTPGADQNNRFRAQLRGVVESRLTVFNREGLTVFTTDDPATGWDGRNTNGQPCPQGAYVYRLDYRAVDHPEAWKRQVGTVTLLR